MKDYGPEAQAILKAARNADDPSELQLRRAGRVLALRLGVGSAVALTSATAWGGFWSKVTVVLLLVGGAGAGTRLWWKTAHPPKAPAPVAQAVAIQAAEPASAPIAPVAAPPAIEPAAAPATVRQAAVPKRRGAPAPSPSRLEAETALMAGVNRLLDGGQKHEALRLLDQYDRRFPKGLLREESAATRTIVHCQIDGGPDAAAQARRFKTRHARSPLLPRVQHACLGDSR